MNFHSTKNSKFLKYMQTAEQEVQAIGPLPDQIQVYLWPIRLLPGSDPRIFDPTLRDIFWPDRIKIVKE